jgi:GTP-binding protein
MTHKNAPPKSAPKKAFPWNSIHFVKSAQAREHYPRLIADSGDELPEVAVVGRSNVGKSSLLNDLFELKNLAKTSSTPGKTQLINFFQIDNALTLVDLPGYGYAKVAKDLKEAWGNNIQDYLEKRENLSLIFHLLDIRHMPTPDDIAFFDWAIYHGKKIVLIFTKTDKVKEREKIQNAKKIISILPHNALEYVYYSTKTHEGRFELRKILLKVIDGIY